MPFSVIVVLIYSTIFLIVLVLFLLIRRAQNPTRRRLKALEKQTVLSAGETESGDLKKQKEKVHQTIEKLLTDISRFVKQDEKKNSKIEDALLQAGYHKENSIRVLTGIRLVSTTCLFLLALLMGLKGNRPFNTVLFLSLLMGFVGYMLPLTIMRFKIRKRQADIAQSLPDALDLLVISVEAGLGLNAALLRVGMDLHLRCPPLAQELNFVNQDLRTGKPREKALRSLSDRNQVEDLRILVGALVLADRLGTSIADTLRSQADSLRTRIRQKAEEQAARAGIKMLFPLIFFILPALIVVLMGPGLIAVFRALQ